MECLDCRYHTMNIQLAKGFSGAQPHRQARITYISLTLSPLFHISYLVCSTNTYCLSFCIWLLYNISQSTLTWYSPHADMLSIGHDSLPSILATLSLLTGAFLFIYCSLLNHLHTSSLIPSTPGAFAIYFKLIFRGCLPFSNICHYI